MLVNLKEIQKDALAKGFGVGAFNCVNLASVRGVIDAAEALNQPVIIQHAEIHDSIAPLDVIGPIMVAMAKAAKVPVCVHLDHGVSHDYLQRALEIGFTSVMYDGSALPYEENLAGTQKAVEMAKKFDASVEAELGRVLRPEGGAEEEEEDANLNPEDFYTQVDAAVGFVKDTGIDALAIAFGTAHGMYDAEPKLDFQRIKDIQTAVNLPLVMHGGSGVSDPDFVKSIAAGITKINYFTYMSLAGGEAVEAAVKASDVTLRYDQISEIARKAIQAHVEHAIGVFTMA